MTLQTELRNWIVINSVKYLKFNHLQQILTCHSPTELCSLSQAELKQLGLNEKQIHQLLNPDTQLIDELIAWQQVPEQHIIYFDHPAYPEQLKQIVSAPLLLFAKGNIDLLVQPQVAIVGSRSASHYGLDNAFQFAAELARKGIVVTSGFATGVDGKAHQGALSVEGATIGVLGTGVDIVYPKRHHALAHQIVDNGGLLLSEFKPGTPARAQHFPRRNRIISGLSLGVLVVEAALKSGSLITARYAAEHNREVFAIPNCIHDPRSRGCHQLLRDGAKLTETVADILEELPNTLSEQQSLNFELPSSNLIEKSSNKNFTTDELLVNLDYKATSIDELAFRSQLPVDVVLARLLDLEMQGLVAAVSGGYVRTRRDEYV
ncbi:DNA-protecting protein DprA [Saccharobesus litoralis]|uniref:DNA-protecting protein DprA n=1 Tax=Saccharobesus litoralis TaxID=2172099 RepID=A0A2S0VQG5_9ALTE|nr:DNA-processing protein DprA [Saccharobesus litoralis]AWB66455.1 DNA-protecting protein DprA [Saccharobesus litoralis]